MKLWQTDTHSADQLVERFTAGEDVKLDAALLYYDVCGTMAHVMGLQKIDILSEEEVAQICQGLQTVWNNRLEIRPEDEDVHTAVENALSKDLGELGQKIHTGRSRNDQILLDLRLYGKAELLSLVDHLIDLGKVFLNFAKANQDVPMPGTTHTRWGMPSSIGMWASSFTEALLEDLMILEAAFKLTDRSPLGAAAGYGVPLPLPREATAEWLGFAEAQINPVSATSGRGKMDHVLLSALSGVMLDLSRLATDLIWGSSETMPFFDLPDAFCTGSSIMPNKQNPDVLELIRGKAARVQADASQAFMIAQGRISGYHRDQQELKPAFMDGLQTTSDCLEILIPLISELKVNEKKLSEAMTSELFAVDEMIEQVKAGVPLRQAYRAVKASLDQVQTPDMAQAIEKRSHLGGLGNLGLDQLDEQLQQQKSIWTKRRDHFSNSLKKLIEP